MTAHRTFASIVNGEVVNIFIADDPGIADWITQMSYGRSPDIFAQDCTQIPCYIGDGFHDGRFWRINAETNEEEEVIPYPTESEKIEDLTLQNNMLLNTVDLLVEESLETVYQISEMELSL